MALKPWNDFTGDVFVPDCAATPSEDGKPLKRELSFSSETPTRRSLDEDAFFLQKTFTTPTQDVFSVHEIFT